MWLLYLTRYEPEELQKIRRRKKCSPKVKLWLYMKVFNTEFNLSFGMPRTDMCSKCDQLELSIRDVENVDDQSRKDQLKTEKEMHLRKAQGAYDNLKYFKKKAAEDQEIDAYTFDFQQNLPVPCVTTSDLFYMQQLWTYNFGVHDLKTGDGIMHIWDESTAQRGSSEVCSCLENTILSRHSQAQRLVLFSDGCSGQNKNKAMITFLASLCANPNKPYQRIDHFYLVRGHSNLPNDRDFALIETRKKGELPQVPKDYVKIIEDSRTVQPFKVVEVEGQKIKDFKVVGDKSMKQNLTSNDGEKVLIRSFMWFSYGASEEMDPVSGAEVLVEHENEIWCRYTHNNIESWKKVKLFKRGVKPEKLEAKQKYKSRICIKPAKYKDLNNLVERGLLSRQVAEFYQKLLCESATNETEHDSEYEDDYVE